MRGLLLVLRHEWVGFARSGVLALMLSVVGGLGVAVAVLEYRGWGEEHAERNELRAQERAQWLGLEDTHIHKAAHRGFFVVRELPAAVVLDRGVWDFGGSAIWLEAHRRNAPRLQAASSAAQVSRGLPRGVGPMLLWLVPLLCVVLLHGIVASERARGSLAFAISSGASPFVIVVGKAFAVLTLLWLTAALPAFVAAGLAISGGVSLASVLLWLGLIAAALGIFAFFVVAISAMTARPLAALVSLLLVWFAMAVLWPRLAPGITVQLAPIPSSQVVRTEAEIAAEGLVSDATEAAVRRRLDQEGLAEPNAAGLSAMASEIDAAAAFARIFAPLEDGMRRQALLLDLASWVSPLSAADRASDALLGLGDRDQFAFEARAESMRFATQMALNEGWVRSTGSARGNPALWESVVNAAEASPAAERSFGLAPWGLLVWAVLGRAGLGAASRAVRRVR